MIEPKIREIFIDGMYEVLCVKDRKKFLCTCDVCCYDCDVSLEPLQHNRFCGNCSGFNRHDSTSVYFIINKKLNNNG